MCGICGCSDSIQDMAGHEHHGHDDQSHSHHHEQVNIEQAIFAHNDHFARLNQAYFDRLGMIAINVMSSPGSGKTTLLSKTISDLKSVVNAAVIVGDQQTDLDAAMLKSSGATAVQINTGRVCHLDAHGIGHAVHHLPQAEGMLLFIENIGNLVCPAHFDLGEHFKIVVLSVTEGDNKPLKYPDMFRHADLLLLTKMDLLPYVEFNVDTCIDHARRIRPNLEAMSVSARTGTGLSDWYQWLKMKLK